MNQNSQSGQIISLLIIVLAVVLTGVLFLIAGSRLYYETSKYSVSAEAAFSMAEAGIDKAVASLNKTGGTYSGEEDTSLEEGSYSVIVTDKNATTKIIESRGYFPNKDKPIVKRVIKIEVSRGVGVAFNYGVQVGEGGLRIDQQSEINGGVYSNGNISLDQQVDINGDVFVAGGTQPTADSEHDCVSPCSETDYQFGKSISGENRLDVAQSFKPSQTAVINKVALKLKKIGPGPHPNLTVKILGNNASNNPDKNNILATGTLISNQVTDEYSFIEVGFTSNPALSADTYYWILIDTSSNPTNYWSWSNDPVGGYTCSSTPPCLAKFSPNHLSAAPVWTNILGDLSFKVFMGGVVTSIDGDGTGGNLSKINGSAHANTLTDLVIEDQAFYQAQSNISAGGQNCATNPSPPKCNPASAEPPPQPMPISAAQIAKWKDQADANIFTGDITDCPFNALSLVSGKYEGDVILPDHCIVTVDSPVWITGNFIMNQQSKLRLNSSYGASSGVFIVDGVTNIYQQNRIQGSCYLDSCANGSYLVLLSEFNSKDDPEEDPAIVVNQQGNSGILYANLGEIEINQQNEFTEVTAWKLYIHQQVIVNYDTGLAGSFFTSGPSGAYSIIKGTYKVE